MNIEPRAVDFLNNIGRLLDEPNADSSCLPTFFLSGLARQHVTVAIGGDGGDEMFGGYHRYIDTLEDFLDIAEAANLVGRPAPPIMGAAF